MVLRECELEAALAQTRSDLVAGRVVRESAEAHLERIKHNEIAPVNVEDHDAV